MPYLYQKQIKVLTSSTSDRGPLLLVVELGHVRDVVVSHVRTGAVVVREQLVIVLLGLEVNITLLLMRILCC